MGLELRPNLKLPMHTSLFCFEGQRPLVERAGLYIGKSFQILSHLKTNWLDSLSIFVLFSYYGTFFLLFVGIRLKKYILQICLQRLEPYQARQDRRALEW